MNLVVKVRPTRGVARQELVEPSGQLFSGALDVPATAPPSEEVGLYRRVPTRPEIHPAAAQNPAPAAAPDT